MTLHLQKIPLTTQQRQVVLMKPDSTLIDFEKADGELYLWVQTPEESWDYSSDIEVNVMLVTEPGVIDVGDKEHFVSLKMGTKTYHLFVPVSCIFFHSAPESDDDEGEE